MSGMGNNCAHQGRMPSATMMLKFLLPEEEAADMTALEYYENLNREKRSLHKPKDADGKDIEFTDEKPTRRPHRFRI